MGMMMVMPKRFGFSALLLLIYMYFFYLVLLLLICICMLLYQNRLWIQSKLVKATIVSDVSWPITRRKLWAILPPWQLHLTWLLIFFFSFLFPFSYPLSILFFLVSLILFLLGNPLKFNIYIERDIKHTEIFKRGASRVPNISYIRTICRISPGPSYNQYSAGARQGLLIINTTPLHSYMSH